MEKKIYLIIIILSLIFISCNKQSKLLESKKKVEYSKILNFSFPDTVLINQQIFGKIKYELRIDTINTSDIYERYIILYVTTNKKASSLEEIEKTNHNSFIDTVGDGSFHFKAVFTNPGENLLNALIEDIYTHKGSSKDTVNITTERSSISWKVYVKD